MVLELVLEHEPEHEALSQQRVRRVEVDVVELAQDALAHVRRIGAHGLGPQRRQLAARRALLAESVVHLAVRLGERGAPVEVPQQP